MKYLVEIWQKLTPSYRKQNQKRTVKFMFPLLVGMIGVLMASVISTDKSYVKLVPSDTALMSGDTFSLDVYVNAHVPVNAIDITIGFSPEMVEIDGVDTGNSVLTVWTHEPTIEKQTVKFSGGTFRRGFLGEHLIATINAKAKYSGKTEFAVKDIELLAGDGSGTKVAIDQSAKDGKTSFFVVDQNENTNEIGVKISMDINPDIDGDGKVSLKDVSVFMSNWHSKNSLYDFNDDGKMNFVDFSIILAKSFFGLVN